MRKLLAFLLLLGVPVLGLDYTISVRLDPDKKLVTGTARIVWENTTETPTDIIPLHLYMNAFSNDASIFMRESGGRHRQSKAEQKLTSYGYCKILSVAINGEPRETGFQYAPDVENLAELGLFQPDEITPLQVRPDNTIGVVQLEQMVEPGQNVTLDIEFETRFPRVFARTGFWQDFFFAGQWYPKPAVFEGEAGWNCHFFHLNSEFFADFASYSVTLDVPDNFVLGATGVLADEQKAEGRLIQTYRAENVHDFAWTAWDHWQVATDKWKTVDLVLLYPPGNERTVDRQMEALKAALDGYAELCGYDYPYPRFTLVDPPRQAGGAMGMEYPMLVTGATPSPMVPLGLRISEMVIIHEFGHNYFYGMLAFNEFEHAWMDEGMNSFATSYALERHYKNMVDLPFLKLGAFDNARIGYSTYSGPDIPARTSWGFSPGGYSTLSYSKPEVFLKTLQNMLGDETFLEIFHTFFERYKFQHPTPDDFFSVVQEIGGDTAHDFMRRMVYTRDQLDFAVRKATSKRERDVRGLINFEVPENKNPDETAAAGNRPYINIVIVENRGDFEYPVDIKVELEADEPLTLQWDGTGGWKRFEFTSESPMTAVIIDPEHVYACDIRLANNARVLEPKTGNTVSRISAAMAAFLQMGFNLFTLAI